MEIEVEHDTDRERFVVALGDGSEAYLEYRTREDGSLDYSGTFVPEAHRGRGIAEQLVVHALEHAREAGRRIVPSCPYVRHVVEEEHPEYGSLVTDGDPSPPE